MTVTYMIAATLAALAAWGYLLRFTVKTRGAWLTSITGVALVAQGGALALALTFLAHNLWWVTLTGSANWPGRQVVGSILYFLVMLTVVLIWIAFEKAQKK